MGNDLRMLMVEEESGHLLDERLKIFEKELGCKIDHEKFGNDVIKNRDPYKYNVAVIDGSNDNIGRSTNHGFGTSGYDHSRSLSRWIKSKNSEIIIIGTSLVADMIKKENIPKEYNELIFNPMDDKKYVIKIKGALQKYGFEFPGDKNEQ